MIKTKYNRMCCLGDRDYPNSYVGIGRHSSYYSSSGKYDAYHHKFYLSYKRNGSESTNWYFYTEMSKLSKIFYQSGRLNT